MTADLNLADWHFRREKPFEAVVVDCGNLLRLSND